MKKLTLMLFVLILFVFNPYNTLSREKSYFQSELDSFKIIFPEKPVVKTVKKDFLIVRSYQANEVFDNNFIAYQTNISYKKDKTPFTTSSFTSKKFLASTLNGFLSLFGKNSKKLHSKYFMFKNKYDAIEYKIYYNMSGVDILARGIFFLDEKELIVVKLSITYNRNLDSQIQNKYSKFIRSFKFLK